MLVKGNWHIYKDKQLVVSRYWLEYLCVEVFDEEIIKKGVISYDFFKYTKQYSLTLSYVLAKTNLLSFSFQQALAMDY